MTGAEARAFLLKPESYCNIDFPPYMQFGQVLSAVSRVIGNTGLERMQSDKPRNYEGVNYPLLSNKDGRHAWRPLQLIHPAIYVALVNHVTTKFHWEVIRARFCEFQVLNNFKCLSIPVRSRSSGRDKAAQIVRWWQDVEQKSIELALDYTYVVHADITDCYAAIYTHSVAWALHGKAFAKKNRSNKLLIGNIIDNYIQDMRHGQTNGIPQGSVLMDLISEMVLGYTDLELNDRLKTKSASDYLILRYRDDYRIFVNNPQTGETILKELTEVMIELGLKLNTAKTTGSSSVISSSLKPDKLAWLRSRQGDHDLQKHLLVIHAHGLDYPNAGSLTISLAHYFNRLNRMKKIRNPGPLVSIAVDIACGSPRTFPVCAAIISKVLNALENDEARIDLIQRVHRKLSRLPHTGHMEIWLQRICYQYDCGIAFKECLCQLVDGKDVPLWNNDWISAAKLKAASSPTEL